MDPAPSTPVPQAPPQRFRWRAFLLSMLAALILCPICVFLYFSWATHTAWAEAEAEADRLDPHWRLAELIERQPAIADKDNAALHIIAVKGTTKLNIRDKPNYETIFKDLSPNVKLNAQQLKLILDSLDAIPEQILEARKLKDMSQGRFSIKFSDDYITTLIPNHHSTVAVSDWLVHDAFLLAHDQKIDEAMASCRASLNCGRVLKDDLFIISHLIRVHIQTHSCKAIERVIAQGEPVDDALQSLQRVIAKDIEDSNWLRPMRGERAGGHHLFQNIRNGQIKSTTLRGIVINGDRPAASSFSGWLADTLPSTMLKDYPEHLRLMTECVEIAKLPIHEQKPLVDAWDKKQKESTNPIISLLAPGLAKVYERDCRSQANLRTALVGLACERYRLQHKTWPASLDDLVTAKLLDIVPLDPVDGKSLRYRHEKDNIVIYSIGLDGVEIGFRLWHPEKRAAPPMPPVKIKEAQG